MPFTSLTWLVFGARLLRSPSFTTFFYYVSSKSYFCAIIVCSLPKYFEHFENLASQKDQLRHHIQGCHGIGKQKIRMLIFWTPKTREIIKKSLKNQLSMANLPPTQGLFLKIREVLVRGRMILSTVWLLQQILSRLTSQYCNEVIPLGSIERIEV